MYNGNPLLRKAGEKYEYTQEMITEYVKCKEDIIYFAESYFYIVTNDDGKILIKCWDFQKKILKAFVETPAGKRHCIVKIPRGASKCVYPDTKIKIRNKITGEITEISIEDFYTTQKRSKS